MHTPLLQNITNVKVDHRFFEGHNPDVLVIEGYRTDYHEPFVMRVSKKTKDEWKIIVAYFIRSSKRNDSEFEEKDEDWDRLLAELIDHPQVRLHTLFV